MAKLLLVSSDLMLHSRLQGVAQQSGLAEVVSATSSNAASRCDEDCPIAVVDLHSQGSDIAALVADLRNANPGVSIIASGPHVHEQKLQQAEQAGCDVVVSRGQLDRDAAAIFQQLLA